MDIELDKWTAIETDSSHHRKKVNTYGKAAKRSSAEALDDSTTKEQEPTMKKNPKNNKTGRLAQLQTDNPNKTESIGKKHETARVEKYGVNAKGPFFVLIKPNKPVEDKDNYSFLAISRKLYRSNIKYTECAVQSRYCWKVVFNTRTEANNALDNVFLKKMGFDVFIPHSAIHSKGVIRGIPLDVPMDEIVEVINMDNAIKASQAFRLKRRNAQSGVWEESTSICVELISNTLPDRILIWRTAVYLSPYIPPVKQCYKCGKIGHISKTCGAEECCLSCAESHTEDKNSLCNKVKKCVNCGGPHSARDRSCPIYKKHSDILRYMAINHVSFIEARRFVNGEFMHNQDHQYAAPLKTMRNFPRLTSRSPMEGGPDPRHQVSAWRGVTSSSKFSKPYVDPGSSPPSHQDGNSSDSRDQAMVKIKNMCTNMKNKGKHMDSELKEILDFVTSLLSTTNNGSKDHSVEL